MMDTRHDSVTSMKGISPPICSLVTRAVIKMAELCGINDFDNTCCSLWLKRFMGLCMFCLLSDNKGVTVNLQTAKSFW